MNVNGLARYCCNWLLLQVATLIWNTYLPPLAAAWLEVQQLQEVGEALEDLTEKQASKPHKVEEEQKKGEIDGVYEVGNKACQAAVKRGKIVLSSADVQGQEEALAACGVLGRAFFFFIGALKYSLYTCRMLTCSGV